jgi:hypothetical protein
MQCRFVCISAVYRSKRVCATHIFQSRRVKQKLNKKKITYWTVLETYIQIYI